MNEEKPTCPFCGSEKIRTRKDIGFDIDPSGEERQHQDVCECGAWRFNTEFISFDNHEHPYSRHFGKWHPKEDGFPTWPL